MLFVLFSTGPPIPPFSSRRLWVLAFIWLSSGEVLSLRLLIVPLGMTPLALFFRLSYHIKPILRLPRQEVAVKKFVGGEGVLLEKTLKNLRTECVLLSRLKHRNIIALVGATTNPVTCVMQYCSRGNLMVLLDDPRCGLTLVSLFVRCLSCTEGHSRARDSRPGCVFVRCVPLFLFSNVEHALAAPWYACALSTVTSWAAGRSRLNWHTDDAPPSFRLRASALHLHFPPLLLYPPSRRHGVALFARSTARVPITPLLLVNYQNNTAWI